MNCWLVITPAENSIPPNVLEFYTDNLLVGGSVHSVGATSLDPHKLVSSRERGPTRIRGWRPNLPWAPDVPYLVLIFHDAIDTRLDELASRYEEAGNLYGVIYATGIMVAGPACPARYQAQVLTHGDPLDYQALFIPTRNGMIAGTWQPYLLQRRSDLNKLVAHAYQARGALQGAAPILESPQESVWPNVNATPFSRLLFAAPLDGPGCLPDIQAALRAWHLSKVALLGQELQSMLEHLDNRCTLLLGAKEM